MSKKEKVMQNQLEMNATAKLTDNVITFYRKGIEVQFDVSKLTKRIGAKLKSANTALQIGQLKYLLPKKGDVGGLGYPSNNGGITPISLKEIAKAVIIPATVKQAKGYKGLDPVTMQEKYLTTMFPKMLDKIKLEDVVKSLQWALKARELGVKMPYGWEVTEDRWIKTIKIILISKSLIKFYDTYQAVPTVKAIRCLINTVEPFGQDIIVTSDPAEFSELAQNDIVSIEENSSADYQLQDVTVILQQGGMGVVPGTTVRSEDGEFIAHNPATIECDLCICKVSSCKVNYLTMEKTHEHSKLVVYLPWYKRLQTSPKHMTTNPNREDIKLIAQKIAIALQYPLEYINWRK